MKTRVCVVTEIVYYSETDFRTKILGVFRTYTSAETFINKLKRKILSTKKNLSKWDPQYKIESFVVED